MDRRGLCLPSRDKWTAIATAKATLALDDVLHRRSVPDFEPAE